MGEREVSPRKGEKRSLLFLSGVGLAGCLLPAAGCRPAAPAPRPVSTAPAAPQALPASDPVDFLRKSLERYDREGIRGYRLVLEKQERIDGKLQPPEVVAVSYRARPHSVLLRWLQGARRAQSVLYVEGANGGKMLVHPTGVLGRFEKVVALDPEGPQAHHSGRYTIKQFGLRETLERTLHDWKAAREEGALHAEYAGTQKVAPAGDRPCYTLVRTLPEPDEEGVTEVTVYIDEETWFQVGTVLRGQGGNLLGTYTYRDIHLNPEFGPDQFTPAALAP
jgi:hypothetical protein